jgi:hypothetical protein
LKSCIAKASTVKERGVDTSDVFITTTVEASALVAPEDVSTPPLTVSLVSKKAFASHCKVFRNWAKTSFPKDCTKYEISLMELETEISKIHFTTQHYAPQSLCSTTIVY